MTWLDKQIKALEKTTSTNNDEIQRIHSINPDVVNTFFEATPLKLVFLNYSLAIYSTIIPKFFDKMFYVDLFAGSGINSLRSKNDILIGSPFIATLNHKNKFETFFFCDDTKEFCDTLGLRLDELSIKKYEISYGDCNKKLEKILSKINQHKGKNHIFFFIDPYGMGFEWKSMEKVLSSYSDILFTFMTSGINRAWLAACRNPSFKTNTLDAFFGDQSWKKAKCETDLIKIYKKNILSVRPNADMVDINIDNVYNLLFITNKTPNNNPWLDALRKAKGSIEENSKEVVLTALDKLKRGQTDLGHSRWSTKKTMEATKNEKN